MKSRKKANEEIEIDDPTLEPFMPPMPGMMQESVWFNEDLKAVILWDEIHPISARAAWNAIIKNRYKINKIIMNTSGGSVSEAFILADMIRSLGLITVGIGQVASAGCYLFATGKHRFCLPDTTFLIHAGGTISFGYVPFNTAKANHEYWEAKIVDKVLDTILAKIHCKNKAKLKADILGGKEYFLCAEEAKEKKLVTEIISFTDLLNI